jgi:hypothetical protein
MQRNKATAATKTTCKYTPFRKRLKGFEPSTFCMASRTFSFDSVRKAAGNTRSSSYWVRMAIPRLSTGNHGVLGTEGAPGQRDDALRAKAALSASGVSLGCRYPSGVVATECVLAAAVADGPVASSRVAACRHGRLRFERDVDPLSTAASSSSIAPQ